MINIKKFFDSIFKNRYQNKSEPFFGKLLVLEKTPSNESVKEKEFNLVSFRDKLYWAMFKCPCGCGNIITLPLKKPHSPRWTLNGNTVEKLTLYPSIWQNEGCCSHFWIRDGRIVWCKNTGIEPSVAEPLLYRKK
jgi:hypothetical protein